MWTATVLADPGVRDSLATAATGTGVLVLVPAWCVGVVLLASLVV